MLSFRQTAANTKVMLAFVKAFKLFFFAHLQHGRVTPPTHYSYYISYLGRVAFFRISITSSYFFPLSSKAAASSSSTIGMDVCVRPICVKKKFPRVSYKSVPSFFLVVVVVGGGCSLQLGLLPLLFFFSSAFNIPYQTFLSGISNLFGWIKKYFVIEDGDEEQNEDDWLKKEKGGRKPAS